MWGNLLEILRKWYMKREKKFFWTSLEINHELTNGIRCAHPPKLLPITIGIENGKEEKSFELAQETFFFLSIHS